jgi:hypothetical protein
VTPREPFGLSVTVPALAPPAMLPNDKSAALEMAMGVMTVPVDVALVVAAMALPAPKSAKATMASLKPVKAKLECLFILIFLRVDKWRR